MQEIYEESDYLEEQIYKNQADLYYQKGRLRSQIRKEPT